MAQSEQDTGFSVNTDTAIGVSRMAVGLIPGVNVVADPLLAAGQGVFEGQRELDEASARLGIRSIEMEGRRSPALKKFIDKRRGNWAKLTVNAVAGLAGGTIGFFLLGTIPLVGWIVGPLIGGIGLSLLSDVVYDKICGVPNQDSIQLVQDLHSAQRAGQPVAPELVFAALAANLRGAEGKQVEKALARMTGTHDFAEAYQQGHIKELHNLMKKYDATIRGNTGMMVDHTNPAKTASEQYAEWINSGQLDARRLIIRKFGLPMQSVVQNPYPQANMFASNVEVPSLPPAARGSKGLSFS